MKRTRRKEGQYAYVENSFGLPMDSDGLIKLPQSFFTKKRTGKHGKRNAKLRNHLQYLKTKGLVLGSEKVRQIVIAKRYADEMMQHGLGLLKEETALEAASEPVYVTPEVLSDQQAEREETNP